ITLTGTGYFRQYFSDWGGNVDFRAPRYYTRETHYRGTAYIEKTGVGNDGSYGGNTFDLNLELKNSGVDNFIMGENLADTYNMNVVMNHEGSGVLYIANNSAGNYIGGNLTMNNTSIGAGNGHMGVATGGSSSAIIDGDVIIN